jgi:selenium metabolism protein YedF
MIKELDARGLSCPQPVLQTKNMLEEMTEGMLMVVVDNTIACENVKRFVESSGCSVMVEEKTGEYQLTIIKKGEVPEVNNNIKADMGQIILISTDVLGKGDRKLGETLMEAFIYTLVDAKPSPQKIILLNEGVKLATFGSPVLEALEVLHNRGVEISSCGTCINFYQLQDKLKIGTITNMVEVVASLSKADKVICL